VILTMFPTLDFINRHSIKNIFSLMLFVIALTGFNLAQAAKPMPAPPDVAAKSYMLLDFASGKVLAEKKPDKKIEPASITKLMTAYAVYKELDEDRLSMDDEVVISEKAWRMGGSRMYLEVNSKVSVHDLLVGA